MPTPAAPTMPVTACESVPLPPDVLKGLVSALRTCQAELVMLKPRLPQPYRHNVSVAASMAGAALAAYDAFETSKR